MQFIIIYEDEQGELVGYDTAYTRPQINMAIARCKERNGGDVRAIQANRLPPERLR